MDDHDPESTPGGADEIDDSWLAAAAHEIRAPLLAVKAALESVLEGGEGVEPRHLLERSLSEVEHLAATVEDLLRWAVGDRPLDQRPTDLVALVSAVVERSALDPAGDRIVVHAAEPVRSEVDAGQLGIALANLVRNGLIYGEPEAKVEVSVEARGQGWAEIAITNRGSLEEPDDGSLFGPGVRRDPSGRNPEGSGLGLSIAKRVVKAHGGSLWYESTDVATTFHVRLGRLSR